MGDAESREIFWLCPDPRTLLPLDRFRVSEAAARKIRARRFPVTFDQDFAGIVDACADRPRTWITPEVRRAYLELHRRGGAHSAESWWNGALAGGLYGVAIGRAFMAESMFHRVTDAGMAALAALVERLREKGFELLDVQFLTPHLKRCGAVEVPREEYLRLLASAIGKPPAW